MGRLNISRLDQIFEDAAPILDRHSIHSKRLPIQERIYVTMECLLEEIDTLSKELDNVFDVINAIKILFHRQTGKNLIIQIGDDGSCKVIASESSEYGEKL